MPDLSPFRGIHYNTERFGTDLSAVAAPPYDVIDPERRAHLGGLHEVNAVHLTLPQVTDDAGHDDRYAHAAELWSAWRADATLVADDELCLYLYQVEFEDEDGAPRQMTAVIGLLRLEVPGTGDVLPHERTMSKPKGDRLDLLRATRANLEPIWGLSLTEGLTGLLDADGPPLVGCTDTRGARHRLYALRDPARIDAIVAAVAATPVVIADGHHRYETSLHYQAERREAGEHADGDDWIMTMIVELADDQLAVQPIHRTVSGRVDVRAVLADRFVVEPVGPNADAVVTRVSADMARRAAMALVDAEGIALLIPQRDALAPMLADEPEVLRNMDAAEFEACIAPVLVAAGAEIAYRHDRHTVAEQVGKGAADAAFLLRPVDVPTIRAVAEQHERMPQKTTFFHPKPSTGLVFRSLDA